MSDEQTGHIPSEIKLHQRTRTLELTFNDGSHFLLPAEYLRVYSPAPESQAARDRGEMVTGREDVSITRITPVGNRAIRLSFNDGHDQGVYYWQTLYELGNRQEENWQAYLTWLDGKGYERKTQGGGQIKILYFGKLVERLGRGAEDVEIPATVTDVGALLAWLRKRGGDWDRHLKSEGVTVTVNREFAQSDTSIRSEDEVAIVPAHPR